MPNVAMWGKALTAMPRITKEDWDGLDLVSRWLIATRSAVIIMTFTSAAFAGVLAFKAGAFDWMLFGLVTGGLCLAHAKAGSTESVPGKLFVRARVKSREAAFGSGASNMR